MHIKFKKNYKIRRMTVKAGEVLDVHWRLAIELIKDGTAVFEPVEAV